MVGIQIKQKSRKLIKEGGGPSEFIILYSTFMFEKFSNEVFLK